MHLYSFYIINILKNFVVYLQTLFYVTSCIYKYAIYDYVNMYIYLHDHIYMHFYIPMCGF